jgi:hypothetical protein
MGFGQALGMAATMSSTDFSFCGLPLGPPGTSGLRGHLAGDLRDAHQIARVLVLLDHLLRHYLLLRGRILPDRI